MADIFDTAHMVFIPIVVCCCRSTKSKNHTSTLSISITYFCITCRIYCVHKNKSCAWVADSFPPLHMAFLPTVLWYNKPNKSKNNLSAFIYYLLFVKWNFAFTLRSSGPAKTGPARPIPIRPCLSSNFSPKPLNKTGVD